MSGTAECWIEFGSLKFSPGAHWYFCVGLVSRVGRRGARLVWCKDVVWQCWEDGHGEEGIIIISPLIWWSFVVNVQMYWLMMKLLSLFSESGLMLGYDDLVWQLVEKTSEVVSWMEPSIYPFQWWALFFLISGGFATVLGSRLLGCICCGNSLTA